VRTKQPDITGSGYWIDRRVRHLVTSVWGIVRFVIACRVVAVLAINVFGHHGFDLGILKTSERQVVTGLTQLSEFKSQHLFVPPGIE